MQNISANLSADYVLGQNINCIVTSVRTTYFPPIGNSSMPFLGSLDGAGNNISKLTRNRPTNDSVGLFGSVAGSAKIKSLALINFSINGANYVGSLAGTISDSVQIENVYSTGKVNGSYGVGGLVGFSNSSSSISNSYSTANVTANNLSGGLVGIIYYPSSISNSFATGNVSGSVLAGGVAGSICAVEGDTPAAINNVYWNNHTENPSSCSGLCNTSGCSFIEDNLVYFYSSAKAPMSLWDFTNIWQENPNSYPTLIKIY